MTLCFSEFVRLQVQRLPVEPAPQAPHERRHAQRDELDPEPVCELHPRSLPPRAPAVTAPHAVGFHRIADTDSTQRGMDYLAQQLTTLEANMIDPQEFGRLQAEVAAQRRDLDRMANSLDGMSKALTAIQDQLSEARGGWKLMLMVGGASATVGALIAKAAFWWAKTGAPGP